MLTVLCTSFASVLAFSVFFCSDSNQAGTKLAGSHVRPELATLPDWSMFSQMRSRLARLARNTEVNFMTEKTSPLGRCGLGLFPAEKREILLPCKKFSFRSSAKENVNIG